MGSADGDPSIGVTGASGMAKVAQLLSVAERRVIGAGGGGQLQGLQQMYSVWWGNAQVCVFLELLFSCRLLTSCVPSTARSMGSCAGQTRSGQSMTG